MRLRDFSINKNNKRTSTTILAKSAQVCSRSWCFCSLYETSTNDAPATILQHDRIDEL